MLRALVMAAAMTLLQATNAFAQNHLPPGFVYAAEAVPGLIEDIRYFGSDNFVGAPIDGYEAPRCILTREAARALARVQAGVARAGYRLKVYDCYRPQRAVTHFMRWSQDATDTRQKEAFYPAVDKADLFAKGYVAERSGHSRGSTVDLTLVRAGNNREVDMGTTYDFMDPLSWSDSTAISPAARANRRLLRSAMERQGFRFYREEWWHYTLASEPYKESYFDFVVR